VREGGRERGELKAKPNWRKRREEGGEESGWLKSESDPKYR
jgi:hypothetical protein